METAEQSREEVAKVFYQLYEKFKAEVVRLKPHHTAADLNYDNFMTYLGLNNKTDEK